MNPGNIVDWSLNWSETMALLQEEQDQFSSSTENKKGNDEVRQKSLDLKTFYFVI